LLCSAVRVTAPRPAAVAGALTPGEKILATATSPARLHDTALEPVREKVLAGRRLSFEDGLALYRTHDLLGLGQLANHVRERKHGDAAYFVWNTHINHTNVCVATCNFCAFAAKKDDARAYTMAVDEVVKNVSSLPKAVREVHVVGGLHPDLPFSYFTDMLRGIKQARPDIHVKAFTAVEVFFFHRLYRKSVELVLTELREAGLDSMPGGGAEIFASETRSRIIKGKADAAQWLDVMRTAHGLGIPSNATMLYGHVESLEDRVDHLLRLRELQDETGGFVTFIPLAFQPWEAPAMKLPETTGFDDLKAIAVARLMLDNVPHVKSYWIMITPRLAQVGLSFGADDIDGTVTEEKIAHDAGAQTPQVMTVHELVRLVREAGRRPVERDTLFNVVKEW
jgi:aminodeoxyfutalosine synthase